MGVAVASQSFQAQAVPSSSPVCVCVRAEHRDHGVVKEKRGVQVRRRWKEWHGMLMWGCAWHGHPQRQAHKKQEVKWQCPSVSLPPTCSWCLHSYAHGILESTAAIWDPPLLDSGPQENSVGKNAGSVCVSLSLPNLGLGSRGERSESLGIGEKPL